MKLVVQTKLLPTTEQATALMATLDAANAAANQVSRMAWDAKEFGQYALHRRAYTAIRAQGLLAAQMVVRLIAKVADAYKVDQLTCRVFNPHGSIAYDDRILHWYAGHVTIWTTQGRQRIPFVVDNRGRALLAHQQGESDLVYRSGKWYLLATVNVIEPPEGDVADYLGVDLGIVNIAADSDGEAYAGAHLNGLRHRHRRLRRKLQAKGTRGAKRLLAKRRRKDGRHASHVNHTISKRIVAKAKDTKRGIALEDLKGIRARLRLRKPQRATVHSWSFHQLGRFLAYKARLAGVPLIFVDPRNTSRTCIACGHCEKANRLSQARFLCRSCGFSGLADHCAAVNIASRGRADLRGAVNHPHCSGNESCAESLGQSPFL